MRTSEMTRSTDYIKWFDDIRNGDIALVGGKNASLGELYGTLQAEGIETGHPDDLQTA